MTKKILNKYYSGFTLIELLVVIAIIGILSSIILASLSVARAKSADVTIKGDLYGIISQSEVIYDTDKTYANVCTNSNVTSAVQAALNLSLDSGPVNQRCFSDDTGWVAWAPLKTSGAGYWCTDYTSNVMKNEPAGTVMPTSVATCP